MEIKVYFLGGVFSYLFRKSQISGNLCWRGLFYLFRLMFHLEISPKTNIGKGLYVGHPYGITINAQAVLGENCNIHKGVTIYLAIPATAVYTIPDVWYHILCRCRQ